jgi:hypothetical protein
VQQSIKEVSGALTLQPEKQESWRVWWTHSSSLVVSSCPTQRIERQHERNQRDRDSLIIAYTCLFCQKRESVNREDNFLVSDILPLLLHLHRFPLTLRLNLRIYLQWRISMWEHGLHESAKWWLTREIKVNIIKFLTHDLFSLVSTFRPNRGRLWRARLTFLRNHNSQERKRSLEGQQMPHKRVTPITLVVCWLLLLFFENGQER